MIQRLTGSAGYFLLRFWTLLPILGNLLPPLFFVFMWLRRDRSEPMKPHLVAFAALCAAYTLYIGLRSVTAGPLQTAIEPTGDAFSLFLTAYFSAYVIRSGFRLDIGQLFKGLVVMLFCIFAFTALEQQTLGTSRPALFLGNPLNLTPLLLLPAVLCTYSQFAPSRFWAIMGLVAFMFAVIVIGGISQTRGPFIVLIGLSLIRILFAITDHGRGSLLSRISCGAGIAAALTMAIGIVVTVDGAVSRYAALAQFPNQNTVQSNDVGPLTQDKADTPLTDKSMDLRVLMLKSGWKAFVDRPIWGHGPQYRFSAAAAHFPRGMLERFSHLHNDFLTHAVAGGIPAIIFLCLILASPAIASWRYVTNRRLRRELGLLFTVAFSGIAAVNNVLFVDISAFALGLSFTAAFLILENLPETQFECRTYAGDEPSC